MKLPPPWKHIVPVFWCALLLYAAAYTALEHLRTRKGPWQVTFISEPGHAPALIVSQPALGISNAAITFPGASAPATNITLRFSQPYPVPFDEPLGRCLFMDTTFLPGTLVFNLYDHEVQLIPRVLTIDRVEYPWKSDTTLTVTNRPFLTNSAPAVARQAIPDEGSAARASFGSRNANPG
jgi:hypothetical protein